MTFRSETETLRARVEELEREKAELVQVASKAKGKPPFDPLRLFRRIAWFLLNSTELLESRPYPDSDTPTAWGFFCALYTLLLAGTVLLTVNVPVVRIVGIPTSAVLFALPLLRIWLRYGMRLDDDGSKTKWEKRFE